MFFSKRNFFWSAGTMRTCQEELAQDKPQCPNPCVRQSSAGCSLFLLCTHRLSLRALLGSVTFQKLEGRWDLILDQLEHAGRADWCSCLGWSSNRDCQICKWCFMRDGLYWTSAWLRHRKRKTSQMPFLLPSLSESPVLWHFGVVFCFLS